MSQFPFASVQVRFGVSGAQFVVYISVAGVPPGLMTILNYHSSSFRKQICYSQRCPRRQVHRRLQQILKAQWTCYRPQVGRARQDWTRQGARSHQPRLVLHPCCFRRQKALLERRYWSRGIQKNLRCQEEQRIKARTPHSWLWSRRSCCP